MRRTHRLSARSRRWTSLFLCTALVVALLMIKPQANSQGASSKRIEMLNPLQQQSQRGRQRPPRDSGRKIDSIPTAPTVSLANMPTLDQVRRHKLEKPKAPDPIPSMVSGIAC